VTKLLLLLAVTSATVLNATPSVRKDFNWQELSRLAIQDRGRLKPIDTFARETVLFITGKSGWAGMIPIEVVFSWLVTFENNWENEPFVRVDYSPLKKLIKLDPTSNYFSPVELSKSDELKKILRDAVEKDNRKEKLSDIEKKAVQIQNQLGLLEGIVRGDALSILPNPAGINQNWYSLAYLIDSSQGQLPYIPEDREKLATDLKSVLNAYLNSDAASWNASLPNLATLIRTSLSHGSYPTESSLSREIQYNKLRPFRLSWILYVLAFATLLIFQVTKARVSQYLGAAFLFSAFGVHAYGFFMRCMIAGRPPVTNMFESVIWVTWGCVLFSLFIWAAYKNSVIPTAASVFAIVGLVLADNLPAVLDPSIQPLEPVLRSNFWLTIHVLTITLSYAAFALSLCLGNVVLGNYLFRTSNTQWIQQASLYMYRAVQIGVVLLAAGTILGGVWADYSWGRFWGWDPKEVWALTALLLYLAVLHGRYSGWLRGFGFVAATVMSFLGVLMAWYGVNFVLGVGLHSYGFGSGGLVWVSLYIGLQIAFILAAYAKNLRVHGPGGAKVSIFPKN
jgi:ABC-type transport system involved in cytochrome c biogenesis permease subunit